MLAYVFWHRPYPQTDARLYEESLKRFRAALGHTPSPGFIAAGSYRIEPVPWLGDQAGYEDWCLVAGSWALDPLNGFAVAGHAQAPHDQAAALMEYGQGGLYAHVGGGSLPDGQSTVYWLARPRGIQWQPALEALRTRTPQANVWRRQMVLGPATEFAVEVPDGTELDVPAGWQARRIRRTRLLP